MLAAMSTYGYNEVIVVADFLKSSSFSRFDLFTKLTVSSVKLIKTVETRKRGQFKKIGYNDLAFVPISIHGRERVEIFDVCVSKVTHDENKTRGYE